MIDKKHVRPAAERMSAARAATKPYDTPEMYLADLDVLVTWAFCTTRAPDDDCFGASTGASDADSAKM